jgi:outer membrane lipoprotein-sorting protein
MKRLFIFFTLSLLPLVGSATALKEQQLAQAILSAKNAKAKGLAIARMTDYRDNGWIDSEAKMKMTLKNRYGRKSTRNVRVRSMEVPGDGDKGLSIFDTPRDVKGTAVLTWSHALKPDHQWMYLPALRRVKRISSRNKSGPFMGSEFAYEDIASQELEKYSYRYLRDGRYEGKDCYVVQRKPKYRYSGYKRMITWIDKKHFNPQKVIYFDRKNSRLKTLTFQNYKSYNVNGKNFWRAEKMFMQNHQTGKSTELKYNSYRFNRRFTKRDFDKSTLKRYR